NQSPRSLLGIPVQVRPGIDQMIPERRQADFGVIRPIVGALVPSPTDLPPGASILTGRDAGDMEEAPLPNRESFPVGRRLRIWLCRPVRTPYEGRKTIHIEHVGVVDECIRALPSVEPEQQRV